MRPAVAPLDEAVDHVRGAANGRVVLVYVDYLCPYSRVAYHAIREVERASPERARFALRHFPLIGVLPHALAASTAVEAAALQQRFWEMSELLFERNEAFLERGPRRVAAEAGLDLAQFDADRTSRPVLARVMRDVEDARASGQVRGTPTVFVDGVLHGGSYDAAGLAEALSSLAAR